MGKKQGDERKLGVQEARRGSGSASLADRPTNLVKIEQLVENFPNEGLEKNLPQSSKILYFSQESDKSTDPYVSEEAKRRKSRRWTNKNVYGLSVMYVVLFSAFIGLQNLQSSINSAGGLGLVTLSLLYSSLIISGFFTPGFLKLFGTKYSLLFGCICHLIYTLTNYYPSWYTLVPASILIGFAFGPTWSAACTHLLKVAVIAAPSLREKQDYLISKFTGIFFFIYQFSQIPGNLASSLILFPYDGEDFVTESNFSNDSSGEICNYLETATFDAKYLYMLVSVYVMFIITSIVLLLIFVDRLPTNNSFFSTEKKFQLYLKEPLIELLKVLKDKKMLLLAPMVVYNGMELAFAFGTFTEHYISQCFGTYQVGFTLIVFGISSAVTSIVYSNLFKCIPRFAIVLFGSVLSAAMLLFMLFWERVPSYYVIFTIAIGWGAADAVWTTMTSSLTGILFASCSEVAYSAMRIWQACGLVICFTITEVVSFRGRVLVLLGTVLLAGIVNLIIEFTTQSREELLPCVYCIRKRRPKSCSGGGEYTSNVDNKELENGMLSNSSSTKLTKDAAKTPIDELFQDHNSIGQNPMFIVYGGCMPNASMSTYRSADSLESTLPSTINPTFSMYHGHRPSLDSFSQDKSFGTSRNSTLSTAAIKTLSPLGQYEDSRNDPSIIDSHRVSIQRTPSYKTALNNIIGDELNFSQC